MDNNRTVQLLLPNNQHYDVFTDRDAIVQVLPPPNQKCISWQKIVITSACICALVVVSSILVLYKQELVNDNTYSEASSYTYNANGNLDLRIHTENISCVWPSCLSCKTEVDAHRPESHEAKPCRHSADKEHVKNGTCYLCGNVCKSYNDIKDIDNIPCGNNNWEIMCCVKALMCQYEDLCNGGLCQCYQDKSLPMCVCPPGRKGLHCQESNREEVLCSCLATAYKFSNEENIPSCNDTSIAWTDCHMHLYVQNKNYNCLCQGNVAGIAEAPSCYSPHQDMLTSGASRKNLVVSIAKMAWLFIVISYLHRDS